MTRRTITERRLALLEAVIAEARHVDGFIRLDEALEDLDAYCPRCDDAGVIARVLGGEPTSPPPVTERPCECEASRVIAAKRADQRRKTA